MIGSSSSSCSTGYDIETRPRGDGWPRFQISQVVGPAIRPRGRMVRPLRVLKPIFTLSPIQTCSLIKGCLMCLVVFLKVSMALHVVSHGFLMVVSGAFDEVFVCA